MTGFQFQREFERLLQARNIIFQYDEKPDTETIFGFLNIAQLRVLKQKYLPSANTEENIINIQNNAEDLKNLITYDNLPLSSEGYSSYTKYAQYPDDYLHYIRSDSIGSVKASTTQLPNKLVSWKEMDKAITNVYNSPILRKPFVVLMDSQLLVTHDYLTSVSSIKLTYLKTPKPISLTQTSELAEYLHEDIAQLAVSIFEQQRLTNNDSKRNE